MLTPTKPIMATLSALGVFSRTEQRVLQAIFKAIVDGDGCCVATLATLARASNTSRTTTRNALVLAVAIGMLEETEHGSYRFRQQATGFGAAPSGRQYPPAPPQLGHCPTQAESVG
jgi:hypothetical protein